jgi:predicted DNA-binding transcriptional regulator AlpA
MELIMKILSARQVAEKTSLSIPQIRRMSAARKMPTPIKISQSRLGWSEVEVDNWLHSIIKMEEENEA